VPGSHDGAEEYPRRGTESKEASLVYINDLFTALHRDAATPSSDGSSQAPATNRRGFNPRPRAGSDRGFGVKARSQKLGSDSA
jgi:hypothetical protein